MDYVSIDFNKVTLIGLLAGVLIVITVIAFMLIRHVA